MPNTVSDLQSGLLRCFVSKGMFPDEYAIEFSTASGQKVSLFAAKSDTVDADKDRNTGFLKVNFYSDKNQSGAIYVLLPSETLEQGHNVVPVSESELIATQS